MQTYGLLILELVKYEYNFLCDYLLPHGCSRNLKVFILISYSIFTIHI